MRSTNTILISILILISSLLSAQSGPLLDIVIQEDKVNKTTAEQAGSADVSYQPGDTVQYQLTATNIGDQLLTEPVIVDPIPAGVTYIPQTVEGDGVPQFSVDGGNIYQDWPPQDTVRNRLGFMVKRDATPEMITHIKWIDLDNLAPEQSAGMSFQVVVNQ